MADSEDHEIIAKINDLEVERRRIEQGHVGEPLDPGQRERLDEVNVELDRLWDLVRQRRALRDAGSDPGDAHARPAMVVENYEQ